VSDRTLVVYDNHEILYAYGDLDALEQPLVNRGLRRGEVVVPFPHHHRYNAAFDADEDQLMRHWKWKWFPLQEGDDP
jgi:hypothetical protein